MADFKTPGVFLEKLQDVVTATTGMSGTVAGFLGITERGPLGSAVKVTSWSDYVSKYAYGLNSPFYLNSYLGYSVYGFFQNGGKECYIVRVAHSTATKASLVVGSGETAVTFTALDEGTWGNSLSITVSANEKDATLFDVYLTSTLKGSAEVVKKFMRLSNTPGNERYYADVINASKYIKVSKGGALAVKAITPLAGGVDGLSDLVDTDYTNALSQLDMCEDLSFLAIPGQTSATIYTALKNYSANNLVTTIFDLPLNATVAEVVDIRDDTLSDCLYGATYYPAFKVVDPLSLNGVLKTVPNSGHIIGVMARMILNKGIGSTPAGTDSLIKGAVELVSNVSYTERDTLFDANVNVLLNKRNFGNVIWGKKSISLDKDFNTVAKCNLYNYIYKMMEANTQFAVFETNGPILWGKLTTLAQEFLNDLWVNGNIYGLTAEEAYTVKCDDEINDAEAQATGMCYLIMTYKPNPTADYVVVKIGQKTGSN